MDIEKIKELCKLMKETGLSELSLKEGVDEIKMSKPKETVKISDNIETDEKEDQKNEDNDEDLYIHSPIVGTFYSSSSPETTAFVNIGDNIKKGQTVCIIEAMKLMNEIEAEFDAQIEAVLVSNEQKVEYGQPLFKIRRI
ncbi:acetyl-CoA carboxylase biotin carboxyl carrier protein [Clostridium sp. BJN0001]|uniref:acetyl-CoA carboxylase biotin carboxyl carrier protein n=1 Tax=Clostridium sp. BJN0001 TaxID=2930219 RepID=UPI001FD2F6EB|nr:acetyl-CoA carboxylase biotin carboxyl carrier protein [Clostridium sp. BJN0001]